MNDAFSQLHPAASFAFFAAVITLTMLYMHPVLLIISLTAAAGYVCILKGARHFGKTLIYLVPFLIFMSALNALFNHAGVTPLFYLSNGNAVTKESLTFGFYASVMFSAVILWFECFNVVMTSDKLLCLFGRLSPSVSLLLSMALRVRAEVWTKNTQHRCCPCADRAGQRSGRIYPPRKKQHEGFVGHADMGA